MGAKTHNGFEYNADGGEVTITGYEGSEADVNIPAEIGGKPVTALRENSFQHTETIVNLTSV